MPVLWAAFSTENRLAHIHPPFGQVLHIDSPH